MERTWLRIILMKINFDRLFSKKKITFRISILKIPLSQSQTQKEDTHHSFLLGAGYMHTQPGS